MGSSKTENREVFTYSDFQVSFQNGRVTNVSPKRMADPSKKPPQISPPAEPPAKSSQITPLNKPLKFEPLPKAAPLPQQLAFPPNGEIPAPPPNPPSPQTFTEVLWTKILKTSAKAAIFAVLLFGGLPRIIRKLSRKKSAPFPLAVDASATPPPTSLTLELLRQLEWRRFEKIVADYFQAGGYVSELAPLGPDGGIDIYLFKTYPGRPVACVQCKAWDKWVGATAIRELLGAMSLKGIPQGYFVTTDEFAPDAKREFAEQEHIRLISGPEFVSRFNQLPPEITLPILREAFSGDHRSPTCIQCGDKMVLRKTARPFWGCRNFPTCQAKPIPLRRET